MKLLRAQNDAHSKHVDQFFAAATLKRLDEIASLLGLQIKEYSFSVEKIISTFLLFNFLKY